MCGLVGIVGKTNEELLHKMTDTLTYRGPDDSGYYVEKDIVAFGHRRLSIIDIAGGKQPFKINEYCLIYNGEIYNYLGIKKELEKHGHVFNTKSDTEVLLRSFIQYGPQCLEKFNGIFAFAIWNSIKKELFLARDRFGVCPLYFSNANSNFYFASETKALLKVPEIKKDLNYKAIDEYLMFRYVRSNITFFNSIQKFPPAHFVVYKDNNFQLKKYWDLGESKKNVDDDFIEQYKEILKDAVKIRALSSDVPVGAYLSSGIDSSSITTLMSNYSKLQTFTIGFNSSIDELEDSRKTALSLGSDHNEFTLQKSDWKLLPQIIYHLDEPVGDPIILPTYCLSSFASKKAKVVLTGDGADELLGGYIHHQSFFRLAKLLKYLPNRNLSNFISVFKLIPNNLLNLFFPYPADLSESGKERAIDLINSFPNEISMYLKFTTLFSDYEKDQIYSKDLKEKLTSSNNNYLSYIKSYLGEKIQKDSIFERVVLLDINTWLPNQILHKSDRLLLANSLEGRQPFLDYRLAELVYGLPDKYTVSFWQTKLILRKAMQDIIPRKNVSIKKKAFYMPLDSYFFDEYKSFVSENLSCNEPLVVKHNLLNKEVLKSLIENNLSKRDLLTTKKLFALATLEQWLKTY